MTKAGEKWESLVWVEVTFEWYEYAIVFYVFIFIFMFRNNEIREQLGQNSFRRCYGFFQKYHSESTWPQRCSKFSVNNYEAPWELHLKDTLQLKILWTLVSSQDQDIELIIVCFSVSQISVVFKFNLMLIEQFLPQFIYLSVLWYCILKFMQYLWASMLFLCEDLQLRNVIIFLFWNILVPVNDKNYWH